ncbi:MAG: hypothetical protein KKC75_04310 [Nanoarchaeota archaeon]|nr:hypothetical protein [Nanoarchaeota archaeon]MBU1004592.1 hypothetical protein [Nanoarchaeota archaeon]MBU1946982.1 hypothetical protein [Nanoarchaeota archaeon]
MVIYVIEHLEPRVWRWCIIEYKHISSFAGKGNLWFTNIKNGSKELEKYGKVFRKSVSELGLKRCCVLDPEADKTLQPEDSKEFDYFIFGGILGDNPPKKRTKEEITLKIGCESRNIGKEQMSTDNAAYTVKKIVSGKRFNELKFKDKIEIELGKNESVILPYRYNLVDGKPLVSKELVSFLKRRKSF